MEYQRLHKLIEKVENKTATAEEIHDLDVFYLSFDKHPGLTETLLEPDIFGAELEVKIWAEINRRARQPKIYRLWPRVAAAAAIILIVFAIGGYFYERLSPVNTDMVKYDISPGKNGATLTLANGKKILIGDVTAGEIATESGVKIIKSKDGEIIYQIAENADGVFGYNTLTTVRGEQTKVILPDGTLVFLNAASSLKYPTSFAKMDERSVFLTGEGYFEVAKDKTHPFIVETNLQKVKVLGTHFNINAYSNEFSIKTTLIEGSVNVANTKTQASIKLNPGEQSILHGNVLDVQKVEAEDAVAWKEGYFIFNSETLAEVMSDVERWYDVDVVFKDNSLKQKTLLGSVGRFENISRLLEVLEATHAAKFELKGRQIIVR